MQTLNNINIFILVCCIAILGGQIAWADPINNNNLQHPLLQIYPKDTNTTNSKLPNHGPIYWLANTALGAIVGAGYGYFVDANMLRHLTINAGYFGMFGTIFGLSAATKVEEYPAAIAISGTILGVGVGVAYGFLEYLIYNAIPLQPALNGAIIGGLKAAMHPANP
ncbi:hypothetical protein TI05_17895 [Achromatium sp. WMS3]|nr:hypothetical protein TI05_17895 [Achromatium sp. WMS3]